VSQDLKAIVVAYVAAGAAAVATVQSLDAAPLWVAFWADVVATLVIFGCSWLYDNSSFYDAYWSVAPPAIAAYWVFEAGADGNGVRQGLVLALVLAWALRLTGNWARGWTGLGHEDWRYVDIREATGALYWPASLVAIHGMPTLIVFAGCLPVLAALRQDAPLGWLDGLAALVTGGGIYLEARADQELARFRRTPWARSRHPNYFGEMSFWVGLCLFGLAAGGPLWHGIGALSIVLMFRLASLPMIEKRMQKRRPAYAAWMERSNLVAPGRVAAAGGPTRL
jgi:steroid 5-alpha reductase family enzyme